MDFKAVKGWGFINNAVLDGNRRESELWNVSETEITINIENLESEMSDFEQPKSTLSQIIVPPIEMRPIISSEAAQPEITLRLTDRVRVTSINLSSNARFLEVYLTNGVDGPLNQREYLQTCRGTTSTLRPVTLDPSVLLFDAQIDIPPTAKQLTLKFVSLKASSNCKYLILPIISVLATVNLPAKPKAVESSAKSASSEEKADEDIAMVVSMLESRILAQLDLRLEKALQPLVARIDMLEHQLTNMQMMASSFLSKSGAMSNSST